MSAVLSESRRYKVLSLIDKVALIERVGKVAKKSKDEILGLSQILEEFPYLAGRINARIVKEHDDRDVLQLRNSPSGIQQYEVDGNPLGITVEKKYESYLDYLEHLIDKYTREKGNVVGFRIDKSFCEILRIEGSRYYERYVSFFLLEDFERSARDSDRNIRLFNIMSKYAADEYKSYFEQYRTYIISINTRAKCLQQLKSENKEQALEIAKQGLKQIEEFFAKSNVENGKLTDTNYIVLANMKENLEKGLSYEDIVKNTGLEEAIRERESALKLSKLSEEELDRYKV